MAGIRPWQAEVIHANAKAMSWDPEVLTDQCNTVMRESSSRNPLEFPWGLFAWADAPAGIGGGMGAFQWFQELNQALAFVTDLGPAGFVTFDEEEEWLELRTDLRRIAEGFEANAEATTQALNAELSSLLQIDWIGNLDELMTGHGAFPVIARSRFRGDWDDIPAPASLRPIKPEEQKSFLVFLNEYGA